MIVFHNEAWSTLIRTLHSIIRMSPRSLIEEIILVDDASERSKTAITNVIFAIFTNFLIVYLQKQLEDYVAKLPVSVKVLRAGKRSGLVRARIIGAAEAKAPVLTFLDAHCECNKGWLEPLLSRLIDDRLETRN